MKNTLMPTLTALLLIGCTAGPPGNPNNVCDMFEERRSWYRAAERTEDRWGIPVSVTMAFIAQESSFRAQARPPRTRLLGFIPWRRLSTARGYAQALDSTWNQYRNETGNRRALRHHFSDAVDFTGWYNANTVRRNGIAPDDARNLYLAYHEGNTGFARGTYRGKPWLLQAAASVQRNADRYAEQYARCREELGRSWWRRLLF